MNSKTRHGIFIKNQGTRITVGGNPFLVASRVKDFRVALDSERRVEIVSYTQPPGFRWKERTNEIEKDGSSVPVRIDARF